MRLLIAVLGFLAMSAASAATDTVSDITALLNDFLTNNSQAAQHDRFWAEDLIYTSSEGKVRRKPEIMKGLKDGSGASVSGSTFGAEDILVRPYGDMAALTFRLVRKNADGTMAYYRNSGTFLKRNGKWQAVTWQATKATAQD